MFLNLFLFQGDRLNDINRKNDVIGDVNEVNRNMNDKTGERCPSDQLEHCTAIITVHCIQVKG